MTRKELFEANAKISEMHQQSRVYAREIVTSIKQSTPKPSPAKREKGTFAKKSKR